MHENQAKNICASQSKGLYVSLDTLITCDLGNSDMIPCHPPKSQESPNLKK